MVPSVLLAQWERVITTMRKWILFLLVLAVVFGIIAAAHLKRPSPSSDPGNAINNEALSDKIEDVMSEEGRSLAEDEPDDPELPDLRGMSVGTGEAQPETLRSAVNLRKIGEDLSAPSSDKDKGFAWPKTSGKVKKIEDQIREIRDDIDEVTLDTVTRALNALPFVSAEPEDAQWHFSGGEIELEITIPVEDIKIGSRGHLDD